MLEGFSFRPQEKTKISPQNSKFPKGLYFLCDIYQQKLEF